MICFIKGKSNLSKRLGIINIKSINKIRSSRELSIRSSSKCSNIIAKRAKFIIYSLIELEILKEPLDFNRFLEKIRRMILE